MICCSIKLLESTVWMNPSIKSSSETMPGKRLTGSAMKKVMSLPAATNSSMKHKSVINWQINKPEVIHVDNINMIHYTSLRDIMPAMIIHNQKNKAEVSTEILCGSPRTRMKNHLVEQAARAYLQPLNIECNKSNKFFPWNWQKLMGYTPLTFNVALPNPDRFSLSGLFNGFVKKLNLSRALKYLLGRAGPQPVRFLQV